MAYITIDKYDISVYNLYAVRTRMIEQINKQFNLGDAASIPPQISIVDIYPKLTELDLLLGVVPLNTPWAYFYPPKNFGDSRRSFLSFSRIVPTLGSIEKQASDNEKLKSVKCSSPNEEKEKQVLLGCFDQISKINSWMGFIIGRVGQFLQG